MNQEWKAKDFEDKVKGLASEIISFIKTKDDLTDLVILASLGSLMNTFCETIKVSRKEYSEYLQLLINTYKEE